MSKFASKKFWVDTFDRAVATVAQAAIATLTAGVTGLLQVAWLEVASIAGLAGLVSALTSIAFRVPSSEASIEPFDPYRDGLGNLPRA